MPAARPGEEQAGVGDDGSSQPDKQETAAAIDVAEQPPGQQKQDRH
jgi:hypothetical protein